MPAARGSDDHPVDAEGSRRWIPFWILQISELGLGFVYAEVSVHIARSQLLLAGAVLLALLSFTADGPIGLVHIVGRRLHVHLAYGVAGALAFALVLPSLRPDPEGIIVVLVGSIGLVRLAMLTQTSGGGRRQKGRGRGEVIDTTATVVPPSADDSVDDGADSTGRRAGRAAGAAAAAGRRAVEEHRPAVEDQVKRGLRGVGRLAGRLAGPKTPPDGPA